MLGGYTLYRVYKGAEDGQPNYADTWDQNAKWGKYGAEDWQEGDWGLGGGQRGSSSWEGADTAGYGWADWGYEGQGGWERQDGYGSWPPTGESWRGWGGHEQGAYGRGQGKGGWEGPRGGVARRGRGGWDWRGASGDGWEDGGKQDDEAWVAQYPARPSDENDDDDDDDETEWFFEYEEDAEEVEKVDWEAIARRYEESEFVDEAYDDKSTVYAFRKAETERLSPSHPGGPMDGAGGSRLQRRQARNSHVSSRVLRNDSRS